MIIVLAKAIAKDKNAKNEIIEFSKALIENSKSEEGNIDYNLYEDTSKELDFDELMEEFNNMVNYLIEKNEEEKFQSYWQPRIVQITDKYLGRGQKVSQCSREQTEALSLIVDDLKELLK